MLIEDGNNDDEEGDSDKEEEVFEDILGNDINYGAILAKGLPLIRSSARTFISNGGVLTPIFIHVGDKSINDSAKKGPELHRP